MYQYLRSERSMRLQFTLRRLLLATMCFAIVLGLTGKGGDGSIIGALVASTGFAAPGDSRQKAGYHPAYLLICFHRYWLVHRRDYGSGRRATRKVYDKGRAECNDRRCDWRMVPDATGKI